MLDTVEKALKVAAYLVGGAWVYFNYFKGRTHKSRLDCKVSATQLPKPNDSLAKVTWTMKNVGLSKVLILKSGSALNVDLYESDRKEWTDVNSYEIVRDDKFWIEPGETIDETQLVQLAEPFTGPFRVQLVANNGKSCWISSTIVHPASGEKS